MGYLSLLWGYWWAILLGFLFLVFIYDAFFQTKHSLRRNFPLIGRFRYLLEDIGPPLRQYWIANDKEELPFNRDERRWVYASAKGQNNKILPGRRRIGKDYRPGKR